MSMFFDFIDIYSRYVDCVDISDDFTDLIYQYKKVKKCNPFLPSNVFTYVSQNLARRCYHYQITKLGDKPSGGKAYV